MKFQVIFLFFLSLILFVVTEEINEVSVSENEEENTSLVPNFPGDFGMSEGVMRAVTTAGVLVTSVAGLAAILSYLLPLMGVRTCLLTGSCVETDSINTAYNHQGVAANSVYDQQGYSGYQYGSGTFKKRSLEYVGPILRALTAAYDKYGQPPKRPNAVSSDTTAAKQ